MEGAVDPGKTIRGEVALRLSSEGGLTTFLQELTEPGSPQYHHYLARGQFTARFGPSQRAVRAVDASLRAAGLVVGNASPNRLLIPFSGSASAVESAFHTGLDRVALRNRATGLVTTRPVRLPASIAGDVVAVLGLDRLVSEHSEIMNFRRVKAPSARGGLAAGPEACDAIQPVLADGALSDDQVASAYGVDQLYSAGDFGAGQTVDVFELEPFLMSDIATFDQCYFGSSHADQVTVTDVDGGTGTGPGVGEAALDVEDVSAIAPGAKIHVFEGPNTLGNFGVVDTWDAIAEADDARQVTTSWGVCEALLERGSPGEEQVENEIFEQTAAQGQSVFAAAGDSGSDDCAEGGPQPVAPDLSVDDPGSQPYVTSVGGTSILDPTDPPDEQVWNRGTGGGAGGGGISSAWAMPPWQQPLSVAQSASLRACSNDPTGAPSAFHLRGDVTTLPAGTACREVPDVSGMADAEPGITFLWDGLWGQVGGTSSATPLWAAMLAEVNGSAGCSSLPEGVGFVDPLLYAVAGTSAASYAAAFTNVTTGENDSYNVDGGNDWTARAGYNLASGLGSPRLTDADGAPGLAAQLCALAAGTGSHVPPIVASVAPGFGPAQGGTSVAIHGTGFGSTSGKVFFGPVAAAVSSWSPTSVVVTSPASYAPPHGVSGLVGSADVTVVTAGAPALSSAPGVNATFHYVALSGTASVPTVDYVGPTAGPTAGGGTVTILGTGFAGAEAVTFGDVAATSFRVLSDTELTAAVPPSDGSCSVSAAQGLCAVEVEVTGPGGASVPSVIRPALQGAVHYGSLGQLIAPAGCGCEIAPAPSEYDYAPTPVVTSVAPAYASEEGGTTLTVRGSGFNLLDFEWAYVGAGGQNANEDLYLNGVSPDELVVTLPPEFTTTQPISMPFSVQFLGGLSNSASVEFAGLPTVTSIGRHLVSFNDPGKLVVHGQGLGDVTEVAFELQGRLSRLYSVSRLITDERSSSLVVKIPAGFAAATDVLACTVTGCSLPDPAVDTLTLAYPERPVIRYSTPLRGPGRGGAIVRLYGKNDSEVLAVDFGSVPATIVSEPTIRPSGSIYVIAPAMRVGLSVPITVVTDGGAVVGEPRSAVRPAARYTSMPSSPTAPRGMVVQARTSAARIEWATPLYDGGAPITGYRVTISANNGSLVHSVVLRGSVREVTLRGLRPNFAWKVTLRALNRYGEGLATMSGWIHTFRS